jgi:predicted GIY-YIG superfamily endonuclease
MKYVYLLESISHPDQRYIGLTSNFNFRLKEHNHGKCNHTLKYMPWRIKTAIAFTNRKKAIEFEQYLKSKSGRAFAKKRL